MTKVNERLSEFGRGIRKVREEMCLTQEQLSQRSGLSSIYIGTIENGKRDPSLSSVAALAKGLGVTTSALFGPLPAVSAAGRAAAALFDGAPKEVQTALLALLHAVTKRRHG